MLHTLAVLRTMLGLTQKEMAELAGRSARTIQAIELKQLPLSEELALRIAEATGVDEGWLLENDTSARPRRGAALLALLNERGPYTKEAFEWQQAHNATPAATPKELAQAVHRMAGKDAPGFTLPEAKAAVSAAKPIMMEAMDRKLLRAMVYFLGETTRSPRAPLSRWKLRRLMEELAKEEGVELPSQTIGGDKPGRMAKRRVQRSKLAL